MLSSEEALRSTVVLPWLNSLGIDSDQLSVEKSFSLQLGRNTVTKGTDIERLTIGGRLDVLVKDPDGRNLFVMELKAPDHDLTDNDRDQGISYARLLPQMAPFVLLTNGREARIYDTFKRDELNIEKLPGKWDDWKTGSPLATAEDIRIRFEALRAFLGYSLNNMRQFCTAQQKARMASLRNSGSDYTKKYVPNLYTNRHGIETAFNQFLTTSVSLLLT